MAIFAVDSADSGEILASEICEKQVIPLAQPTRSLAGYAKTLPPMRGLRRPDVTGEHPAYWPQTIGVIPDPLAVIERLLPPGQPRPPQPQPLPTPPPGPVVYGPFPKREWFYRGRYRAAEPLPVREWRALHIGLGSVGTVALELAGLAALAVLR